MTTKQIILLATQRKTELDAFIQALEQEDNVMLVTVSSSREALDAAARTVPALVIIDVQQDESHALLLSRQLMQVNAFIHTAIVSNEDDAKFHEQSEGLGVLMRLPLQPGTQEARELVSRFRKMAIS